MDEAVKEARFVVTGEFLTNLARTLWADEGEPEKALRILQAAFPEMPQSAMFDVLTGKQRLEGDSSEGIVLAEDDDPVSEHGNVRSLEVVFKRFRDLADEGEDWKQMAIGQTRLVASPEGKVEVPDRRTRGGGLDADLKDIPYRRADAKVLREKFYHDDTNLKRRELGVEEAERPPPPRPEREITSSNGWLSPDGKFYPCEYGEHNDLAFRLGYEEFRLERVGWLKIQNGNIYWDFSPDARFEPTQRQIDLVFDYCQETGERMPYWIGEK